MLKTFENSSRDMMLSGSILLHTEVDLIRFHWQLHLECFQEVLKGCYAAVQIHTYGIY